MKPLVRETEFPGMRSQTEFGNEGRPPLGGVLA